MKVINVKSLMLSSETECNMFANAFSNAYTVSDRIGDEEGMSFYSFAMKCVEEIRESLEEMKDVVKDV